MRYALALVLLLGCTDPVGMLGASRDHLEDRLGPACWIGGWPREGRPRMGWCGEWTGPERFDADPCGPYRTCSRWWEADLVSNHVVLTRSAPE